MNKKAISMVLVVVGLIIAAGAAWWFLYGKPKPAPVPQQQVELTDDTTESINKAVNDISVDEIDGELSDIDKAIDSL